MVSNFFFSNCWGFFFKKKMLWLFFKASRHFLWCFENRKEKCNHFLFLFSVVFHVRRMESLIGLVDQTVGVSEINSSQEHWTPRELKTTKTRKTWKSRKKNERTNEKKIGGVIEGTFVHLFFFGGGGGSKDSCVMLLLHVHHHHSYKQHTHTHVLIV
jgi:hypothetical protein